MRVGSAHKTAVHTLRLLRKYEAGPAPKGLYHRCRAQQCPSGFTDGAVQRPGHRLPAAQ